MNSMSTDGPVRLLLETDFHSDVDDVGALALAHYFVGTGDAELAAIGINTPSRFGAPAVQMVNDFYVRGSIPIGVFHRSDDSRAEHDYAFALSQSSSGPPRDYEPAVRVLRRALAEAEPHSLTVVSIGFLTNLSQLLTSGPDDISDIPGNELIAQKVKRTVVMGGKFPQDVEFNFAQDIPSAQTFLSRWPGRVEFLGWETGVDVITGTRLSSSHPPGNPVALAYEHYSGRGSGRHSWDLQTVDIAVRGAGDRYRISPPGRVTLADDGVSTFSETAGGAHFVYSLARSRAEIADELDNFLDQSWSDQR